jgi:hypothetical protein
MIAKEKRKTLGANPKLWIFKPLRENPDMV